jgi:glycerol kinase
MGSYLLAIDQGTTGTTALLMDVEGRTLGRHTTEFPQHFPKPGWVEHEPAEIWKSVEVAVLGALASAHAVASEVAAIGMTNQRETTLVWDRATGQPLHRAIVWQCRRTAQTCEELRASGHQRVVHETTGLVLDAYFSATKVAWILDHVDGARERAEQGRLAFGTIDSFLVHRLTGGGMHVTDVSNASRTLLLNLKTLAWDAEMCRLFRVPEAMLPALVGNAEVVAHTRNAGFLPDGIPIAGMAGDQQAALFGQGCFEPGDAKCTFGTGAFALMNIGREPLLSAFGLVTTVGFRVDGNTSYALEGSAFVAGALVQWLRDGLGIIRSAQEIEALACEVPDAAGVVVVPALTGLGAPYWDQGARGAIFGLTRGTSRAHIARAALEGIAFQVRDLLFAMQRDAESRGRPGLTSVRVDGGAAANNLLMQLQADVSGLTMKRPANLESTGRGAALLAGVGCGLLSLETAKQLVGVERSFSPEMREAQRTESIERWNLAVSRVRTSSP